MKAKIQFTVDIQDIPDEVRCRLEGIFYKSENTPKEIQQVLKDISEDNVIASTKKIDKIRKDLSFYDSVLEDAYNILLGYVSYQTKELEKQVADKAEEIKDE